VEIEIPVEDFDAYYDEAMKEIIENIELPGFRKGKVPSNMAEKYVSPERILGEAAEKAAGKGWMDYLKESSIEAVSQPELQIVKIAKGNPFIFTASVEILSTFDLPDLKKLSSEMKKQDSEVTEKEVEDAISWLRNARAVLTEKEDSPAEKGDFAEFTFSFYDIPEAFSHLKGEQKDGFILGKGHYIEGLEESILGMKKGEEKDVEGKMTQKIDKEKDEKMSVKLKVKIDSIQKMDLPELTDEWVKSLGRFETIADLKEDIKKGLGEEKRVNEQNRMRVEIIDKIVEQVNFEIPPILLKREEDNLFESLKERVNYEMKIDLPKYFEQIKKTEEEVKKEFEKLALERMKRFLVLHQISKSENISATDEEVNGKLEELLKQYPDADKSNIDIERVRYMIADDIVREKIFAFLGL
jgi:trigger factor